MRYLYKASESFFVTHPSVIESHPHLSSIAFRQSYKAGEAVVDLAPGSYLIREQMAPGVVRERYLGIVGDYYTVLQLTIGSFTSDLFDHPLHSARVPGVYYAGLGQVAGSDSTLRGYQQEYGDDICPHLMANGLGIVCPEFAQEDPNWDSLSAGEIVVRLRAFDAWWQARGLAPLRGFATYTPSNSLIQAMKTLGWNILHSIVPEQNWSDGRWCINHWGMPNQPFYMADDDFRKAAGRGRRNVIGMSMNSYHLYMPHVVNFGDNVLSPSHFLRWHRTVESGPQPERFTNFLLDYLQVAKQDPEPFFLIAGFEFGRSFGVRSMTTHNRRGMERIIALAKEQPIVFATASDVAAYYEKFQPRPRPAVFTQRDYLAGTRIMDKPINSGPSIGMEMDDFKAVFAHLEPLPHYHYDYTRPWQFAYDDMDAPTDYAQADRKALQVTVADDGLTLEAAVPLPRAIPVALWDAVLAQETTEFQIWSPPVLDDGRRHTVAIAPAGWSGRCQLPIRKVSAPPAAEFAGLAHPQWRVQEIGQADRRHAFLYLQERLPAGVEIPFRVPAPCRIDSPEKVLGEFQAGQQITLRFDDRHCWYRFWGLTAQQLQPEGEAMTILDRLARQQTDFAQTAPQLLQKRQTELDQMIDALLPATARRLFHLDCFGSCPMGERSRAGQFDRLVYNAVPGLTAREFSDGGIAVSPGVSYWVHPRGLHFEISGLTAGGAGVEEVTLHLFSLSPPDQTWRYRVACRSGDRTLYESAQAWSCPQTPGPGALLSIPLNLLEVTNGRVDGIIRSDQPGVLDDWFRDGGFIATLQRLLITGK